MSTITKKSKIIAATAFILGALAVGSTALADTHVPTNPEGALVSALAEKFNLNTADVQAVVDEVLSQKRVKVEARHEQALADRLAQGVQEGTITKAQADLIMAKETEMKATMESLKDKTHSERAAALKTQMKEMKHWATDHEIPIGFLQFGMHHKGPRIFFTPAE